MMSTGTRREPVDRRHTSLISAWLGCWFVQYYVVRTSRLAAEGRGGGRGIETGGAPDHLNRA